MSYCEFCGEEIKSGEKCNCPQAHKKATKSPLEKKSKLIGIILACSLAIIILIACLVNFAPKKDPFKYIEVSFSGVDTLGQANVLFNESELITSIIGEEPSAVDSAEGMKEYFEWYDEYETYQLAIEINVSKEENLSNGEEITVQITVTDVAADKIASGEKKYTVSGLTQIEKVDVFKSIELVTEGVSGNAAAEIKLLDNSTFFKACEFDIDPKHKLSNGDKVIVTIKNSNYLAEKYNKAPQTMSKEFAIQGLGSYVTSADQISQELIKNIADKYLASKKIDVKDDFLFTYSEVKYYGSYLYVEKADSYAMSKNELRVYVYYNQYMDGELRQTIYAPIIFNNIIINPNGNIDIDYDEGSASTFVSDIEESLEKSEKDYTIFKLD